MLSQNFCARTCGRTPCPPTEEAKTAFALQYSRDNKAKAANATSPAAALPKAAPGAKAPAAAAAAPKEGQDFIVLKRKA